MIANGSIVTYNGQWIPGVGINAGISAQHVSTQLASMGFTVLTQSNDAGFFDIGSSPVNFTMKIEIDTGYDYATSNDVKSLIDHAVYVAVGVLPISSIPIIQVPGGKTTSTGQPGNTDNNQQQGCQSGTSKDLQGNFDLTCWFKNLTTTGFASVGVLALLAVLGIGIFIFAVGRVPRAA